MSTIAPSLFDGAAVPIYLFPALLLLPSSDPLPLPVTEPPHLCIDLATCPTEAAVAVDVDVADVISEPAAFKVNDVTFKSPVDASVVNAVSYTHLTLPTKRIV